jgi:hypothetical protein
MGRGAVRKCQWPQAVWGYRGVRHHYLKHLPVGKDRNGQRKDPSEDYPETGPGAEPGHNAGPGAGRKPWPGWKPKMTDTGLPSWTAPSGRTYPPPRAASTPPILPNAFTHPNPGEEDEEADVVHDRRGLQETENAADRPRPDGGQDPVPRARHRRRERAEYERARGTLR